MDVVLVDLDVVLVDLYLRPAGVRVLPPPSLFGLVPRSSSWNCWMCLIRCCSVLIYADKKKRKRDLPHVGYDREHKLMHINVHCLPT